MEGGAPFDNSADFRNNCDLDDIIDELAVLENMFTFGPSNQAGVDYAKIVVEAAFRVGRIQQLVFDLQDRLF